MKGTRRHSRVRPASGSQLSVIFTDYAPVVEAVEEKITEMTARLSKSARWRSRGRSVTTRIEPSIGDFYTLSSQRNPLHKLPRVAPKKLRCTVLA